MTTKGGEAFGLFQPAHVAREQHASIQVVPAWWAILKRWFTGPDRRRAWGYCAASVVISVLSTLLSVKVSYAQRNFSTALADKDTGGFYKSVWEFVGIICVAAPFYAADSYVNDRMSIAWRDYMTHLLMSEYFSDRAFFRLKLAQVRGAQDEGASTSNALLAGAGGQDRSLGGPRDDDVDNPDQRITEDVQAFVTSSIRLATGLLSKVLNCAAFAGVLWSISPNLVVFLFAYALGGTLITTLGFGRPLMKLYFRIRQREADLRFVLMRVRESAESIAFYRGEAREHSAAAARLAALLRTAYACTMWRGLYDLWNNVYNFATILVPSLLVAPRYFAGEVEFGVVNQAAFAFNRISAALSVIVNNIDQLSGLAAETQRLAALFAALEQQRPPVGGSGSGGAAATAAAAAAKKDSDRTGHDGGEGGLEVEMAAPQTVLRLTNSTDDGDALEVERLTAPIPGTAQLVASELSLSLKPGDSLLILGPSGCGKSSLLRLLSGLWEQGRGTIRTPPVQQCFFLPQRPFMPLGSLREQLLFPSGSDAGGSSSGGGLHVNGSRDDEHEHAPLLVRTGDGGGDAGEWQQTLASTSDAELLQLLGEVNLGDLAGKLPGGLDAEQDWSHVLSVGEQQRVAFARLLLHSPRLAVLDEATSALDAGTEGHLYEQLRGRCSCYVSVGHRLQLLQYHTHVLQWRAPGQWVVGSVAELQRRLGGGAAAAAVAELHLL